MTSSSSPPLRALLVWGNRLGRQSRVTTIAAGAAELRIPLGVECRGGCELRLYLASGADATRDLGVPTSPLFALTAPELAQFSMDIDVPLPSDELDVALALGVRRRPAAPLPSRSHCVTPRARPSPAVRSSSPSTPFLTPKPHPPANLSAAFALVLRGALDGSTTSYDLLASATGSYSADKLERLLGWSLGFRSPIPLRSSDGQLVGRAIRRPVFASHTYDISEMLSRAALPRVGRRRRRRAADDAQRADSDDGSAEVEMDEAADDEDGSHVVLGDQRRRRRRRVGDQGALRLYHDAALPVGRRWAVGRRDGRMDVARQHRSV